MYNFLCQLILIKFSNLLYCIFQLQSTRFCLWLLLLDFDQLGSFYFVLLLVLISYGSCEAFVFFGDIRYFGRKSFNIFCMYSRCYCTSYDLLALVSFVVREPEGFCVWNGPPFGNGEPSIKLEKVICSSATFSEDGSRLMVMKPESVICIYDCSSFKEIRSFQVSNVLAAALSPCGTYLQTFQKSLTPQDKNVVLWKIDNGDAVYHQFQKNMTKTTWYFNLLEEVNSLLFTMRSMSL